MIQGQTGNPGHVRFILDGVVKTIPVPVTGAALHAKAGNPTSLTAGGEAVPNTSEPYNLDDGQELISKFHLDRSERLPPDGVEHRPAPKLEKDAQAEAAAEAQKKKK